MPQVSAWANELREVFGKEGIDAEIRKGNFYACENGVELGTRLDLSKAVTPVIVWPAPEEPKQVRRGR